MLLIIVIMILVIGLILLGIGIYDGRRFVVIETTFMNKDIKEDFSFALLSDLHNRNYGKDNDELLKAIEKANPEAVLIAGDLLTSKEHQKMDTTICFMNEICKRWPVYYAMGNHETKMRMYPDRFAYQYEEFVEKVKNANLTILQNQHVTLPNKNIDIYGLEMERLYYKRFQKRPLPEGYMKSCLGDTKEHSVTILMAHNPLYFDEYTSWGADYVLAGHVHGGIMKLPVLGGVLSPSLQLFPKYDGGIFKQGKATMLLSRGIGVHSIPLRFFNPCELHIVTIKKAE